MGGSGKAFPFKVVIRTLFRNDPHFNIDIEAVDTYRDSHDPCSDGLQVDPAQYTAELRHRYERRRAKVG